MLRLGFLAQIATQVPDGSELDLSWARLKVWAICQAERRSVLIKLKLR
jgi:hypothetical protein